MSQISITRLQAQISAIEKKIKKGQVKNEYAAKIKVYNLSDQLNRMKIFNFLAQ